MFDALGIPTERLPSIAWSRSGPCVVAGSGHTLWSDVAQIRAGRAVGCDVICVNDTVMHWPGPVVHFYSNDWKWLGKWVAARRPRYVKEYGPVEHTHSCNEGAKHHWPWPGHGTSALNAVYTALALGYESVTIVGVPLDNGPHYFDPPWATTNFAQQVGTTPGGGLKYWSGAAREIFGGRVRALSGRLLGVL